MDERKAQVEKCLQLQMMIVEKFKHCSIRFDWHHGNFRDWIAPRLIVCFDRDLDKRMLKNFERICDQFHVHTGIKAIIDEPGVAFPKKWFRILFR